MKLRLPILSLLLILFLFFVQSLQRNTPTKVSAQSPSPTLVSKRILIPSLQPTQSPVYYPPKRLSIPKIGLTANVVSVGLDNRNAMDVPNNFVDVGWYNLGSKPGEQGSTVLDGHSDDFHGNPAVFYALDTLSVGDQISVTDQSGRQFTYVVSGNEVYPVDGLPLQQIFASQDAARLNLITCHGQWDTSIQTYNQRTVIYAVLSGRSSG